VSNALSEQVFWYKAKVGHKFKLCSQEIWGMQQMDEERRAMGLTEEIDPDDDYNPAVMRPKKNQPKIRVKRV